MRQSFDGLLGATVLVAGFLTLAIFESWQLVQAVAGLVTLILIGIVAFRAILLSL